MTMKIPVLLLAPLLLVACHRKMAPATATTSPVSKSVAVKSADAVKATNTAFQYLSAKGKAQVEIKGDLKSANLNLRLKRDSAIWVSASLLGIEGVRALLTTDSVRVINRLEKTYFAGGYDYLSRLLQVPVSFAQVQALLLGDYLPAPAGTTPTVAAEATSQRVRYPQASTVVEQLLQASGRMQQLRLSEAAKQREMTVDYADFKALDGPDSLPFAYKTSIRAQQAKASTTATLDYSKVVAGDARLSFPFSVPASYKKMK